jgi:CO/xanthine dehydrogenase Mo-binding subunit
MASRRQFFKDAGGLLIGFSMADSSILPRLLSAAETAPLTAPVPSPARLDAWLRIEPNEIIRVFTGKVEIGMGVQTAMSQIVAEELDVPWQRIALVMGDTAATPDQGGVGGSTSIAQGAKPIRNAAATARAVLLDLASQRLGAPVDQLEVHDGVVSVKGSPGKSVSYGALAGGEQLHEALRVSGSGFAVNVEGQGKPKDPASYTVVGQSIPRIDLPKKIFGKAEYATDIRVPGMLHGRVIRPPAAGATFVSLDDSAAKSIAGYRQTVVKQNFVGVVGRNEWAVEQAVKAVKVTWSNPAPALPADLYAHMRAATPKATRGGISKGDVGAALGSAAKKLQASYEWPFNAHATMGPGCGVADVKPEGVTTIWSGAQKPHALQKGIAELMGIPAERVRIVWVEDAGSYGRAGHEDVAADAALLSQAVGSPVRVQWSRADMTAWGGKGPATIVDLAAAFDSANEVTALDYTSRAISGAEISPQPATAGNFLGGQLAGFANKPGDEYVQWGDASSEYSFKNVRSTGYVIETASISASPLRTTHLRDPGGPAGTFAGESFVDEMAAAAGMDPVAFRLKYLEDPRAKAVLTAAAEHARWETRPSPKRAAATGNIVTGRGIALALRGGTHVATVAEVEIDRHTGSIRVKRFVCAHDCGLIVNPDALRGTIQANLIQSMSRALIEEVTFDQTRVTSTDWKTYPIARWSDIPAVEVVLINRTDLPPSGAGEPSTRPTAAALNNAIFDATGVRLRRAPLTAARLKAALVAV